MDYSLSTKDTQAIGALDNFPSKQDEFSSSVGLIFLRKYQQLLLVLGSEIQPIYQTLAVEF